MLPFADSRAVFNLRDAAKKLHSASSAEGVQYAQRNEIDEIAGELANVTASIGDAAVDNAERLWRDSGCSNVSNRKCRNAQRHLTRAFTEQQILRQASDTLTRMYQAEQIWKRVVRMQHTLN